MLTMPLFNEKQEAIDFAKNLSASCKQTRFVVCLAGRYLVRKKHVPGPLASYFAEVSPDGSIKEGF